MTEQFVDELLAFQGIEHPQDLSVIELLPARDVPTEQILGEVHAHPVRQSDLASQYPEFAAALFGDAIWHHPEDTATSPLASSAATSHTCADGLDRSFVERGRCRRQWSEHDPDVGGLGLSSARSRWWNSGRNEVIVGADGRRLSVKRMREAALTICEMCPVQWQCVTFAIDSSSHFTWGCSEEERSTLAELSDWRERVLDAQDNAISVRSLIRSINTGEPS